eukprot:jgi/Tetstr1/440306/TSEL_028644.t1
MRTLLRGGTTRLSSVLSHRFVGTSARGALTPRGTNYHPYALNPSPAIDRRRRDCRLPVHNPRSGSLLTRTALPARAALPTRRAAAAASGPVGGEMFVLGLTGSIGMGKSTVSAMFAEKGVPVMDSDAVVHRLYAPGGAAVPPVQSVFPDAIVDGGIDRAALSKYVVGKEEAMKQLEAIVHPLVEQERASFLQASQRDGHKLVVLDIPLLYETNLESKVDAVAVVSAGADAQRARVLDRPGMTEEKFEKILSRQVPDEEKRQRADHVINTNLPVEETRAEVEALLQALASKSGSVAGELPAGH